MTPDQDIAAIVFYTDIGRGPEIYCMNAVEWSKSILDFASSARLLGPNVTRNPVDTPSARSLIFWEPAP